MVRYWRHFCSKFFYQIAYYKQIELNEMTYLFCSNSHNALPSSLTKKFNCLYIFKFSIFAVHKKEKCSILRGSKIFPITVQIVLQYLHNVSMRVKYFPFLLQILIILGSAWIWEENDMARFYQYSSSLKWSQQMTFPMDQVCGENPDNHSFLAISMIYILWRNLDQYYMFPDYSQIDCN